MIGNPKIKETKNISLARQLKRHARKDFDIAYTTNGDKKTTLSKYRDAQSSLKVVIQKEEAAKIKTTFDRIITEGGIKSQTFWKTRRKILGANKPPEYDTIDQQGNKILDPEESK
jgi:hypothetical protein